GGRQELLGLLRDIPRITRVGLAGEWVDDIADQVESLHLEHRIDEHARRVRHEQHVALVDVLKPADRRAIEADAVTEESLRQLFDRDREVLPRPGQVYEAQVDDLDLLLLRELDDVLWRCLRLGRGCGRGTLDGEGHGQLPTAEIRDKRPAPAVRGEPSGGS